MTYSDRQIRRMTEERTVIIDEVNTTTGQIVMHDQYGTTLNASLDFSNPVVSIPVTGESWIAQRRNTSWYLTKRQIGSTSVSGLEAGDTQVSSSSTLYLDAPVTNVSTTLNVGGALNINGALNIPNGSLSLSKLAITGTPSSSTYLRGDGQWATITIPPSIPTGALMMYGDTTAPSGWVLADGSAILRSGANAALFTLYGTRYGIGDGSTTFNLPDMRGRIPVGYAASGGHADVSTLGANEGVVAANRRPKHRTSNALSTTHSLTLPEHEHYIIGGNSAGTSAGVRPNVAYQNDAGAAYWTQGTSSYPAIDGSVSITGSIGTNNANDALDTPSYIVINYIIKL